VENPKAFVSYAGEDRDIAKAIAEGLMAKGVDAFFDRWEILPGDNFVAKLNEGLARAEFFVLLLSEHSLTKVWPKAEQNAATVRMVEEDAHVIPVNLGVESKDLPALLRAIHWVSLTGFGDVESAVNRVADGIYRNSEKPPLGPIPEFARAPGLDLPLRGDLSSADKTVLRILFDVGKAQQFMADREEYVHLAQEKGISREALNDSLAMLRDQGMITIEGAHELVTLFPWAVDACCGELVSDYEGRKRRILVAAVSGEWGVSSDQIREECGEEEWLVSAVLRWAEGQGYLKLQPVYVGHECYSVYEISPVLKRALERLR
jgi:hypothetical protein